MERRISAPHFDGQRSGFLNYEEKVLLWNQITPLEPSKRGAHLLLHMADVARKVCTTVGKDVIGNNDGVMHILNILRDRFAPDRVDCIFQDIIKFMNFKKTTQEMDTYLLEFDILRQKAEARMPMGTGFPDEFASVLCIQNANLTKSERQLVMSGLSSSLDFGSVSAHMRRLFGNVGSAQNQDALVTPDFDTASDEENFEAWLAYRKAQKAKRNSGAGSGRPSGSSSGKGKVKNSPNFRTGETNRRFICNSEYHYAPQRPRKGGKPSSTLPTNSTKKKQPKKPYSSIALESPADGESDHTENDTGNAYTTENSFSTTLDLGGAFVVS